MHGLHRLPVLTRACQPGTGKGRYITYLYIEVNSPDGRHGPMSRHGDSNVCVRGGGFMRGSVLRSQGSAV